MPGIIEDAAARYGLDPELMTQIARIESSGNPSARTGSYKGLFQLSDQEFAKHGGGDIYSAADNARAAAAKIAVETATLRQTLGREPTATEIYMVHQQGPAGFAAHYGNPDAPAWRNMAGTGEGRQKGEGWARQAIWGNVPDQFKRQFGNVDNVTSQAFMDMWRNKVEGSGVPMQVAASGSPGGLPQQAGPQLDAMAMGSPGGLNAATMGAQTTPAGVPMFSGQPHRPAYGGGYGGGMAEEPPMQFAPLQRRPVNMTGLQALLRGQRGFG